ncbi:diguanylate cyclase [Pseudomonas versuta]|uniref:diguanylate cyclase n=2 Tax=Pseudomonas versuta TaxID=1788301 RepID=A0A0M4QHD6_9PSED|nr:diguanylate cyclase [Pseudomonas versuta]ALE89322.1 histidine kinase [Pseudomonas versuta]OKA19764.1 diguanylate cyclase AdrA [Pseudomonas versuta]OKA23952.1 diguanylate cyclase AdrA [Pseudomonas versuta]
MDNQRGKGLSFARRIYGPRTIGSGFGGLALMAALVPLDVPVWVWFLLLFNAFLWPHLAYQLSSRSRYPYRAERRNILIDSLGGGFWAATIQFNPLPTVTIVSMMMMHNVAAGGPRLLLRGLLAQATGALIAFLLLGAAFTPNTTTLQVYACIPVLILYPLAVGMVSYGLAIKLGEHKLALRTLSRTDSLTGLLNHGSWKDVLEINFKECKQTQSTATLALIDIDHFKHINDTYGHIVGDNVLRTLSNKLKENLRTEDLAGRYGGDEFCVILPNRTLAQAREIMERLGRVFSHYQHADEPELHVCLSIGLASCRPEYQDASMWLNEADKALYIAKNTGRNKVSIGAADTLMDSVLSKP